MADKILPSKLVGERVQVTIEFSDVMEWGETILACVVDVAEYSGDDGSPELLLSGSALSSGTAVTQRVHLGVPGVIYTLTFTVTGTSQSVYKKVAKLAILPSESLIPPLNGLFLSSIPYPAEATDAISAVAELGYMTAMQKTIDAAAMTAQISSMSLYGGLVSYVMQDEAIELSGSISSMSIYGGLVTYVCPPEALDMSGLILSMSIYGELLSYNMLPEAINMTAQIESMVLS